MKISKKIVQWGLLSLLLLIFSNSVFAQTLSQAREFVAAKNYDKAIDIYNELYSLSPDSVYTEYLNTLITAKKYKPAAQLVEKQMTLRLNPLLHIDLGTVYEKEGKEEKAKEQYDTVLQKANGDDMLTQRMVKAFTDAGKDDYAILTYEKVIQMLGTPFNYAAPLAKLYVKHGNLDKAIDMVLAGNAWQLENAKTLMLEILGNEPDKLLQAQKELVKKINEQPENAFYAELLTWIFTQKNDWDGALIQIEAIDERNKENGRRLIDLARIAANAKQYETAIKAYDDVIAQGKELPYYVLARSERLNTGLLQLKNNPAYKPEDVNGLEKLYDSFLIDYPKYYGMQAASDYALLLAQYGNDVPKSVEILKKGIAEPDIRRSMAGQFKLQLGDYYVLYGQIWEASLVYSQVDKEFRQDALGEDARFRNAKLAYYRGDFDWAQKQLTILKASTTELIANDAIYLSVLITENVEDSNLVPLQRFAYAGLLLFQNKDKEAETLLDSINKAFPEHPLNDDIIMVRADIARKHHDFEKALGYLKVIYEKYGKDVLGDDAVFKMADIYQNDLHQNDQAKHYYEQLIIDYPGSTYTQTARQRLNELNNGTTP